MSAPLPRMFPFGWPFVGFSLLVSMFFLIWPEIDIIVSGWFFENGEFHLRKHPVINFVYRYGELPVRIVGLGAGALALGLLIVKRTHLGRLSRRALLYVFLTAVIAPGLVVNGVFKEHFGRARPVHVHEFGGDRQFSPPLVITDQCDRNCSFVSSHAACGFYFLTLGFLFTGWTRRVWFAAGLGAGGVLGIGRILQGGHFLSDVLFAGIFVFVSGALLHYFIFRDEYAATRNAVY